MKNLFTILGAVLLGTGVQGQITFGSQGMTISPNTSIYIDSLKLDNYNTPLSISNNSLQVSYQPLPGNPNNSIAKVYEFATPLSFNGTLGLYYSNAELGTNIEGSLQISYQIQSGGVWTTTTNSIVTAPVNYVYSAGYNNSLYRVTAVSSGTVLPIQLLRFDARKADDRVILEWVTSAEKNNDHFIVERSINGRDFEMLTKQLSKGRDGNSIEELNYSYEDIKPFTEDNFYRLQQVGRNGDVSYSPVRLVSFDGEKVLVTVYPNPATDHLFIDIHGSKETLVNIEIYDGQGRVMYHTQTETSVNKVVNIPLSNMTSGMCYLKMMNAQGEEMLRTKFVKQ